MEAQQQPSLLSPSIDDREKSSSIVNQENFVNETLTEHKVKPLELTVAMNPKSPLQPRLSMMSHIQLVETTTVENCIMFIQVGFLNPQWACLYGNGKLYAVAISLIDCYRQGKFISQGWQNDPRSPTHSIHLF